MDPAHEIPSLELLLAQEGWVRALARKLVSRESEAEDVAQSALAVALERPPHSGESAPILRAWLAQVARRLVIGGERAASRRLERERRVARAEALPSASEIHAQEEERRIVVEALLALGEPFRTTLLLRYYRGLEPIEIARAMGVPDSTVRNRLARGLAQLKQKLEARQGSDWRAGCALLAGPLVPVSKGVLIGKGVVMGVNLKVAISCSVVALAGLAWWGMRDHQVERPNAAQLEVASVQEVSSETDKPAEDASKSPAVRVKVEQDPTAPGATGLVANDPVGILVYGAVRQRDGAPTRGQASVRLLSSQGREFSAQADEQGGFAFTGLTSGDWRLSASLTGYRTQNLALQLADDQAVRRIDLALEGRVRIPVRFRTPEGRRLRDVLKEKSVGKNRIFGFALSAIASEHAIAGKVPGRSLSGFERFELGEFSVTGDRDSPGARPSQPTEADGELIVEDRFPMFTSATWHGFVLECRRCESAPEELDFVIQPDQVLNLIGGFRVTILGADDHQPLNASWFTLIERGRTMSLTSDAHEKGVIECKELPPGTYQFALECMEHEPLTELVDVEPGEVRDLGSRELAGAQGFTVEVFDSAGHPLSGVEFCYSSERDDAGGRPYEPYRAVDSDSRGRVSGEYGPNARWLIAHDRKWTAPPLLLGGGQRQRLVMQSGSEFVAVLGQTIPADALLVVRDRERICVASEAAEPCGVVRMRLPPGHYEIELATFDGTLLKKSIELGEKALVIDLAP
jgi:RNA polymerase sigma factor (sigma-70 family)